MLDTVLLGMTDVTAFEHIDHPEKLNEILEYIKEHDPCCVKVMEKMKVQRFNVLILARLHCDSRLS